MWELFFQIWEKRPHYSEVSGKWLGKEISSLYFHHILPKGVERYEAAKFDEENIILLTGDEHSAVEKDGECFAVVNAKRIKLKEKYG